MLSTGAQFAGATGCRFGFIEGHAQVTRDKKKKKNLKKKKKKEERGRHTADPAPRT
jgi:hypothetical protein